MCVKGDFRDIYSWYLLSNIRVDSLLLVNASERKNDWKKKRDFKDRHIFTVRVILGCLLFSRWIFPSFKLWNSWVRFSVYWFLINSGSSMKISCKSSGKSSSLLVTLVVFLFIIKSKAGHEMKMPSRYWIRSRMLMLSPQNKEVNFHVKISFTKSVLSKGSPFNLIFLMNSTDPKCLSVTWLINVGETACYLFTLAHNVHWWNLSELGLAPQIGAASPRSNPILSRVSLIVRQGLYMAKDCVWIQS